MSSATEFDSDSSSVDEYKRTRFEGVIDTDVLDPILRHMTEVVSEYTVVVNQYGWHIRVVNSKNVVVFDVRISNEDFAAYDSVRGGQFGVSQDGLEDMVDFIEVTEGNAHISVEDGRIEMSDGDRLFTDTCLINPELQRERPPNNDSYDYEDSTEVTFKNEAMWSFKKWVRSNKGHTAANMTVTEDGLTIDVESSDGDVKDTFVLGNDETGWFHVDHDELQEETTDDLDPHDVHDGNEAIVEASFSIDFLYQFVKKPLKSQLTGTDYTFVFSGDDQPVKFVKEYDGPSKLEFELAPRASR